MEATQTKTAQHTPGPWKVVATNSSRFSLRAGQDSIGDVWRMIGSPVLMDRAHEGDANARLIAAAPELLAALKTIKDAILHVSASGTMDAPAKLRKSAEERFFAANELASAAIAKAEGR